MSTYCGTFYEAFLDLGVPDRLRREGVVSLTPIDILYKFETSLTQTSFLLILYTKKPILVQIRLLKVDLGEATLKK